MKFWTWVSQVGYLAGPAGVNVTLSLKIDVRSLEAVERG